ncbi:MAG TPA: molybdopterin-dependent oxidoreductase [Tepidisphaeraceae bacterium]|jgi:DMSO/TMAO reductase YedYZ molybdopterin-dependent catalytic subunit|nr:molybdopterin-dependent oxidoreductase [Tepidisphaeraceae bacterium]
MSLKTVRPEAVDRIEPRINRRNFVKLASAAGAAALLPAPAWAEDPSTTVPAAAPALEMAKFPEKTDLILLTDRPPQLETPLKYFATDITPNEAFFVRWHLSGIPTSVDLATFKLNIGGHVESPLGLSMEDLKQFEQVSVVAVNQCSGNSRSLFEPRVAGGQWQNGAMGNARWTGVRLRDLLAKAKVKPGAVDVTFQGLDRPVLPATPVFIKSLAFDHANDGEVIVAYAMNEKPLPMLNGFPLRLIVPGWYATYWVKSLSEINVLGEKFHNFWMDKAYRVPNNPEDEESPKDLAKETVPISKMLVRSLFTSPEPGGTMQWLGTEDAPPNVEGIAFDGGSGIKKVEISLDGGVTWQEADLGPDLGKYSFRRWKHPWRTIHKGKHTLKVRATANDGRTQRAEQNWNRSGYARNMIETLEVTVV